MMKNSSKPIIAHISDFLDYCQNKGFSDNTQENYKRYLKRFIFWLKEKNKENIKPHQLTINDISKYSKYLSSINLNTGKKLKKVSQNYYLIALRALLSYFSVKEIVSPLPDKVKLPRCEKKERGENQYLNLEQIEELLSLPDIRTESGLRDRVILEVLVSNGLKVRQLVSLDIDKINNIIPRQTLPWVEKYINIRKDKNKALFINYRARKNADKRLTARSIERIVNRYGGLLNLPFSLTPEILRWAHAIALLKKEAQPETIQQPHCHEVFLVNEYKYKTRITDNFSNKKGQKVFSPPWHFIEDIIYKEISWLKSNVPILLRDYKANPTLLNCNDCILRKIAILIVNGKVKATEFQTKRNKDLWNNLTEDLNIKKKIYHGKEWHRKMMNIIYRYFKLQNYNLELEPILNRGRADIGVYIGPKDKIYIEVGTVSLYKLWYNLSTMKDNTFLIIPSEKKVIELKVS